MWTRAIALAMLVVGCRASLAAQQVPPANPHERLTALDRLQIDPAATYKIEPSQRIELRRGDAKLLFEDGYLAFFAPFEGAVNGAVFSGRGHILAAPRDPVEKQQLAHFLGVSIIDQDFSTAYLRFTDDTAAELLQYFQRSQVLPRSNTAFADAWGSAVQARNPTHSFRIVCEKFSESPARYFAANLGGTQSGFFDFVLDQAREEPQMFGQNKKSQNSDFYDVWSSYSPLGTPVRTAAFRALNYKIEATIRPDNGINAQATVHIRTQRAGERLISFEFSGQLNAEKATLSGEPLVIFPDANSTGEERSGRASNLLHVLLPRPAGAGQEFDLAIGFHGNVIHDAGNGVLFVGSRGSWYPHLGDASEFSTYDLTLHWPRKLKLAATGTKLDEHEEGDQRTGHWRTDQPASVAGFNLGEYAVGSLSSDGYNIDVYANRQLEQALLDRIRPMEDIASSIPRPFGSPQSNQLRLPAIEPSPADALKGLARDIDSSIRFYQNYSGRFPLRQLSVSQIPGTFGQGWPGLLYVSTFSFLPAETQERAGLNTSTQEHFHDLVPFHEVAHQWWGNVVGWSSYRDQWIDEAMATYLSLLFADSQKSPDRTLRVWLDRYRKRLAEKGTGGFSPAETGSMILGSRLDSSKSPAGFDELVYGKGAWTFHMIREMLREPGNKNPDARFIGLLRALQEKYAYRALSTADLQHELEAVMNPGMAIEGRKSMEWFFADWVRGTGIPHYRVEYSSKPAEKGFIVRGKLLQSGVPDSFVAPVPIYGSNGGYLGRVIASGPETAFHFSTTRDPGKLTIDPRMTILCITER